MVIDVAAHILPPAFYRRLTGAGGAGTAYLGGRLGSLPSLADLDLRWRIMDEFAAFDYRQVPSLAAPPLERVAGPDESPDLAARLNEEMCALVERHPDRFAAAWGCLPLNNPDAAAREVEHLRSIGLPGVQIFTNVNGRALDEPDVLPVIEAALQAGLAVFLHPARGADFADYRGERKSKYEIWQVFGWPYETTVAMTRLAFAGLFDRCPDARITTHHLGGMVPFFASRAENAFDQLGSRDPDGDYRGLVAAMPRQPIEYLRAYYGDTALFGGPAAIDCGVAFFGVEHVLFGSDTPFDRTGGTLNIRLALDAVERSGLSPQGKAAVLAGNARRFLRLGGRGE